MEAELTHLEEKVEQLARLCMRQREENHALRQQVLEITQENLVLRQKVDGVGARLEVILAKMPEEVL
jgi:hypothetical protein